MNKNNAIDYLLEAAGKKSGIQQVIEGYRIDGVDCFEPNDDKNLVYLIKSYDTQEYKDSLLGETDEHYRNYLCSSLEKMTKLKAEFLINKYQNSKVGRMISELDEAEIDMLFSMVETESKESLIYHYLSSIKFMQTEKQKNNGKG